MDKKSEIEKIINLLKSWILEVKFNNTLNFYDINKYSEGLSEKLLNAIFNHNLKDLNCKKKNFPGIDLGDDSKDKIAYQITSRTDFQKFKNDIETFVKKDKNGNCFADVFSNGIKFLVISSEEIKNGRTDLTAIYNKFDFKRDIIKVEDLLPFIVNLYDQDFARFNLVKQILESQFANSDKIYFTHELKEQFLKEYKQVITNNFSRINFFGLDLPKRPREILLYSLFVEPSFKPYKDNTYNYISNFDKNYNNYQYETNKVINLINSIDQLPSISQNDVIKEINKPSFNSLLDASVEIFLESINYNNDFVSFFSSEEKVIPYKNLFDNKRSKVIIGNPGAGKSLLVKHSICKILSQDKTQFSSNDIYDTIPFRVELYKFNKSRKDNGIEFYLFNYLKHTLNVSWITEELVSSIFATHNTLVFYDGLDEVFDIHERIEVRDIIENFTNKYEKSISIVTSRFESYEEVNFSSTQFETIQILDFNETQINDYVNKWYTIEEENELSRPEEIRNCLEQLSRVDKELINSPLLLSLILILYRNQLDIPTTKLEIYESCANTLIETRDVKEKKLDLDFKIKNKIAAFSHIAFWQFNLQSDDKKKKEINHALVCDELKKYLLNQSNTPFEDEHSANSAAKEFLEYAKNRSIYFENNFTHKSFLEYFAAYFLYSKYYYKGNHDYINDIISENINKSSWFVVLELLICKIDTGQPDFEIIDKIINRELIANEANAVVFFLQILQQLRNISNNKINDVISKSIDLVVDNKSDFSSVIFDSIIHLASLSRFKTTIKEQFNQKIEQHSNDKTRINCYYVFNLEADIISAKKNVLGVEYKLGTSRDPYVFILEAYPSLLDWSKYFEVLKYFKSKYEIEDVTKIYISISNSKIFFGKSQFNWLLSCLFSGIDKKQFLRNYGKLKSLGFKMSEIAQVAMNNKFDISQDLLNNFYSVKDESIKKLLNVISKKRFKKSCEEFNNNRNFIPNKTRNFQISKNKF